MKTLLEYRLVDLFDKKSGANRIIVHGNKLQCFALVDKWNSIHSSYKYNVLRIVEDYTPAEDERIRKEEYEQPTYIGTIFYNEIVRI